MRFFTAPFFHALRIRLMIPLACGTWFSLFSMEYLDGIVAVVGNEIVLYSELEAYMLLRLNTFKIEPDSANYPVFRERFLDELIDGKVLLVHAKKDSNIVIKNSDVEQALESHLAGLKAETGLSDKAFEQQLAAEGLTLVKFKSELRKGIREHLVKQTLQQHYLSSMTLTRRDVEDFYHQYKDSLPALGESVRLLKITLSLNPPDSVRQSAFERTKKIKTRLDNGEDFAELARQFSDDPNAAQGGDLGFISKGTLGELAFEEKLFALQPGETSDPFESRLGFHIVSVLAKKNQQVHARQIFISISPPESLVKNAMDRLDSIRTACRDRTDFVAAVNQYSADKQSRARGGDIGWYTRFALPSSYLSAFDTLAEGAVSKPVNNDRNGIDLLMIDKHVDSRSLTLEDDWEIIEMKSRDIYAQKKLLELVKKWRRDTHIDIRL